MTQLWEERKSGPAEREHGSLDWGDSTSHSWEVSSRSFLGGHQLSEWELSYFSTYDSSTHSQTSLVPASPRLPAPSKSRESVALMLPRAYRARKSSGHTTSIPWACRLVNLREAAAQKHRYQFLVPQINQGDGRDRRKQTGQSDQTRPPGPKPGAP